MGFLEEVGQARTAAFDTDDFLTIDLVHREVAVPDFLNPRVQHLVETGVFERVGRGRGSRLLLSRRFYRSLGKSGVYTRKRGLDRETNMALLLRHVEDCRSTGARLEDLLQVLPSLPRRQVQVLLRELLNRASLHVHGRTRAARWYPGPKGENCTHNGGQEQ